MQYMKIAAGIEHYTAQRTLRVERMKQTIGIFAISALAIGAIIGISKPASAREFGVHECSDDCSGHAAGYRWAELHSITDESDCPLNGNAVSFYEGCLVYAEDPDRGADENDDGDPID
jgi:hypothetical protein